MGVERVIHIVSSVSAVELRTYQNFRTDNGFDCDGRLLVGTFDCERGGPRSSSLPFTAKEMCSVSHKVC